VLASSVLPQPQFTLIPLESANPRFAPVTPLECADPKSLDLNFFRMNRSRKQGVGVLVMVNLFFASLLPFCYRPHLQGGFSNVSE